MSHTGHTVKSSHGPEIYLTSIQKAQFVKDIMGIYVDKQKRTILSPDWLPSFVTTWVLPNYNTRSICSHMLEIIFHQCTSKKTRRIYSVVRYLWAYAAIINRINISSKNPRFTRINQMFEKIATLSNRMYLFPQDLAELEVIRNHLALSLKLVDLQCRILAEAEAVLKLTYCKLKGHRGEPPPQDWETVKKLASRTKYEQIYHPVKGQHKKPALFLEHGKLAPVQFAPIIQFDSPNDRVICISNRTQVHEPFKKIVKAFNILLDRQIMSRLLMRNMILIAIDIVDVALSYQTHSAQEFFSFVSGDGMFREPHRMNKGLFLIWVWCGAMSNPSYVPLPGEVQGITKIRDTTIGLRDKNTTSTHGVKSIEEEEFEALIKMLDCITKNTEPKGNFVTFLQKFDKFYPRPNGELKSSRRPRPRNELQRLEREYVNTRVILGQLGSPRPFFFDSFFSTMRLYATPHPYRYKFNNPDEVSENRVNFENTEERDSTNVKANPAVDPEKSSIADNEKAIALQLNNEGALAQIKSSNIKTTNTTQVLEVGLIPGLDDKSLESSPITQPIRPNLPVFANETLSSSFSTSLFTSLSCQPRGSSLDIQSQPSINSCDMFPSPSIPRSVLHPPGITLNPLLLPTSCHTNSPKESLKSPEESAPTAIHAKRAKLSIEEENEENPLPGTVPLFKPLSDFVIPGESEKSNTNMKKNSGKFSGLPGMNRTPAGMESSRNGEAAENEIQQNSVEILLPINHTVDDIIELTFSPLFITQSTRVVDGLTQMVFYHRKI